MAPIPALPLTIYGAFNSPGTFIQLLVCIGLNNRCLNRLTNNEGISTAQELSDTRPKDLCTLLENINKLFGSKPVNQQIYFTPRLISRLLGLCVYFRRCIMTHQVPEIRLIDVAQVQEFVAKLEEWDKEDRTMANPSSKNTEFKFDAKNLPGSMINS